ncbi:SLC13 family permease [Alkalicoccobacillus gibsonii]|uniref:SLC13 family permease n=1 Tax=Alkalicoccobacillus gibsonii TaxID=79881 RepID=UPI003F7B852D
MTEEQTVEPTYPKRAIVGIILGPLLFLLAYFLIPSSQLDHAPRFVLAITLLIATFWVTEAIPMAVTSLIPLVVIPLVGAADIDTIAASYSSPTIFMYGGGFVIAIALQKWNLHRRIALNIIDMIGTESQRIVLGIIISTAFLSLFVSNAATALMMLPVALALISEVKEKEILKGKSLSHFSKSILLAVAYAATIGGLATLVAAVPNAVFAEIARTQLDRTVAFYEWLLFAGPVALLILVFLYFYLTKMKFKVETENQDQTINFIKEDKKKLGKMSRDEIWVAIIFGITVFLWVFKSLVFPENIAANMHDGAISVFGAVSLFFIPSSKKGERILEWRDLKELPWNVLILFGGGLALASSFGASGLNDWIGETLQLLEAFTPFIIILLLVVIVLSITEILSNTAVANLVLPLCVGLGIAVGMDPLLLMAAAALSAGSCYMLPVATPPNTAVFSAGVLDVADMAKAGVWLNLFSIIVITLAVYFWMPIVFGL